jgi:muconolactone delta-isomerase
MEFLVTMTTRVPAGTPADEVDAVRAKEAAHTGELARQGRVLRLWRPPLGPGEWRTIGLFTADDPDDLERTLAGMPLRVWRTDEPVPLGVHPNDPGPGAVPPSATGTEFLVTLVVRVPGGTPPATAEDTFAREGVRARELAVAGQLSRLWRLPGEGRNLGLFQAADEARLGEILRALPLADWLTVETVPLTRHPSDPGARLIPG